MSAAVPGNVVPRDAYLDLPLQGVQLIEASAGTGKTFTLATLVTRLVVERSLRIGQVLAVTFTEAATQELRKRIRERLQLTLDLIDAPLAEDETSATTLTRQLLQSHLDNSGENHDALRRRLRQATLEIDLAAIFTIHGFCARVLREHALESGQGFDPPELLANDRDLREALAADLWRSHASDETGVDDLAALWPQGHEALAADLPALLREPVLLPPDAALPANPLPALLAAGSTLAEGYRAQGHAFFTDLLAAVEGKVLNGNSYRSAWLHALWMQLSAWCETGDYSAPLDERIAKLDHDTLQDKTNKAHVGKTPDSPLCALIPPYVEAVQAQADYVARRRVALLHCIRDDARARLATLKRQRRVQTYDDMIDGVADALGGDHGDALVQRLREQYAVALVDEFQDTDARQWKIFDRVFGNGVEHRDEPASPQNKPSFLRKQESSDFESNPTKSLDSRFRGNDGKEGRAQPSSANDPALFLIGDPKQAIYGFRGGDVHAYLAASDVAHRAPPLAHNFRSRPSVLTAIDALYKQAGEDAFIDARIQFHHVDAGGKRNDDDFLRDNKPATALTLWQAPEPAERDARGEPKPWSAPQSRELATQACVAAIHLVLSAARDDKATIDGQPVQPGDIAVLVRSHREATLVQRALALAGIPAVAAGKQSLFATDEARDLHALLLALLHTGDDGRLRAALSTVLVGVDAAGIDALERAAGQPAVAQSSEDTQHDWQQDALAWRERLLRGGPLALVGHLCAQQSSRLLGLLDGERRVSNYLQLAELLQEAQDRALGLHGLVDWLGQRIASADANDEAQLLRLESDARRVQIVTLHKSKGLEYPLVFLPFVGIGRSASSPGRHCVAWDETHGRRLHWKFDGLPEAEWTAASDKWKDEQRAEDARLLYVGLTRAEHALWIATGMLYQHDKAPLSAMLEDPQALANIPGIVFDTSTPADDLPRLPPDSDAAIPPARTVTRKLAHDWWVYSFSQLAKADAGDATTASTIPAAGGNDEPEAPDDIPVDTTYDPRFAGNRYGVALHAALEHADFATWRDWHPDDAAPADQASVIADALRTEGYAADLLDDGIAQTTRLIGQTLTVALPEGARLCDIPETERRAEIEFQFSLQPVQVDALLHLLHAHGVVCDRHGFGLRHRLEGLMTGLIDLSYRHDGRWYVLDYKSNRLPAYDAAHLARAMAHSEYDLQALIYTLALHRWLRFRLGDAYDYARDFGGIRYLFCRGLDASRDDAPGIHAQRFTPELVDALDTLFGHSDADTEKPLSPRERGWGEGTKHPTPSHPPRTQQ